MTANSGEMVPVLPGHRFNEAALANYLESVLPGFSRPLVVRQFQGGNSNPTFHLSTPNGAYVLRKKPPGKLLPSAHAIDREFTVMRALAVRVPVPSVHHLCADPGIIGQAFYVMEHIEGRVFTDELLPGCSPAERRALYCEMARVLAEIHRIDYRAIGLAEFGRPEGYVARQIARWSRQYAASKVVELPAMDRLTDWLQGHIPAREETTIVHGDFRIGNLIFHPTEPRVVAVLDWELATIGHPLTDLGYNCLGYRLPHLGGRGFSDFDIETLGIPSEKDYLAAYCRGAGRDEISSWEFFLALSMFRWAAILVGVHRRALDGNAADARSIEVAAIYSGAAERAWVIAQRCAS